MLVDNAGRLLDRQTINAAVWPETVTTDENIAQCVRDVRHAIDDHARSIIRTVPRRGYIFTAEVVETKPGGDTALSRVSTRAIGPTIAVLPFASLGRGITLANLAEGLADEVRTALSRLTPLTVMELCMRWPSAGPGESIRNVNVDYVLTGKNQPIGPAVPGHGTTHRPCHLSAYLGLPVPSAVRTVGPRVWRPR